MNKFITKKKLLTPLLVYLAFCFIGGIFAIPFINFDSKDRGYFCDFQEKALEFVRNQTNVYEKYGRDINLEINKYSWTCEEKYLDSRGWFSTIDAAEIDDIELFLDVVQKMVFYVEVRKHEWRFSNSPVYVVTMIKNDSGDMYISDWYWEE